MGVKPRYNTKSFPSASAKPGMETHMTKPEISEIAPLFIVSSVSAALTFYRDRLGFDITFEGPDPYDIFFGIVRLRLPEDNRAVAESSASRNLQGGMGLHVRGRCL